MPIKRRGDSFYVTVCFGGIRKQGTAYSEIEAAKMEADLKSAAVSECAGGTKGRSAEWTLGEALDTTMRRVWKGTRNEKNCGLTSKQVAAYFGRSVLLSDIDTETIAGFVEHLEGEGNSNGTINRKLSVLGKAMTTAVDFGGLKARPRFATVRKSEGQGRIRFLSEHEEAEMVRILTQWSKEEARDFFLACLDTGLRTGEMRAAEARDLNQEGHLLSVWVNKADLPRSQPLTLRAREILYKRAKVCPTGKLWPYPKSWYLGVWIKLKAHMGLSQDDEFVPHCLRHTFASRLVQRGVPIRTVQELMGHRLITQTMRYAHLAPKNLMEAIQVLEPARKAQ